MFSSLNMVSFVSLCLHFPFRHWARRRMRHKDSRKSCCRLVGASAGTFGRRLFVSGIARYLWVIVGGQWQPVTVDHSHVGHFVVESLEALSVARPGLQWTAPGQVVQSDWRGAVREHLGELLYLRHPGQALSSLGVVVRGATGGSAGLRCLGSHLLC